MFAQGQRHYSSVFRWVQQSLRLLISVSLLGSGIIHANEVPLSAADLRIVTTEENALSGSSVAGAGDVNGDGLADFIVGAPLSDPLLNIITRTNAGRAFVVFGGTSEPVIVLDDLDQGGGFIINGPFEEALAGDAVSGVGDLNKDGFDDLLIGAPGADRVYLVFGKAEFETVDLSDDQSGQFEIFEQGDFFGISVAGAGDFNGDGAPDFVATDEDRSYLQLGGNAGQIVIQGTRCCSVAGAGDVNGDGLSDIIVRAGVATAGVIYGRTQTEPVDLDNIGPGGFFITSDAMTSRLGTSVSGAGDVNGDGFADLIIGDPESSSPAPGVAYVVFGAAFSNDIDVNNLGPRGYRIERNDNQETRVGAGVTAAGDLNADGLADVLVSAPEPANAISTLNGVFALFGPVGSSDLILPDDGTQYVPVNEDDFATTVSSHASAAGDVDGDGVGDIIIGASRATPIDGIDNPGETYVVFSDSPMSSSARYRSFVRNGSTDLRSIGSNGDGSNVSHPNSGAWIGFSDGSGPGLSSFASRVTAAVQRDDLFGADAVSTRSWLLSTQRTNWNQAQLQFRYLPGELKNGIDESRLQLFFAPTEVGPAGPFTRLPSRLDTERNLIRTEVGQLGFFFVGERLPDFIFADDFE